MNAILSVPLAWRLTALFLLGAFVGSQINRGIYRLAWNSRPVGPWSPPHEDAPPRRWYDRLPIFGWFGLHRESPLFGADYWVRPMLIELFAGAGLAALYWWETSAVGLIPTRITADGIGFAVAVPSDATLHAVWLAHAVLVALMLVASFIDIDEKLIPDEITLPGTLVGLLLATVLPTALLPVAHQPLRAALPLTANVEPLNLTSHPQAAWPAWLNGTDGLWIGLACFAAWCFAIWPKTWWTRSGWSKAMRYLVASIRRHPARRLYLGLLLAGCAAIGGAWLVGGLRWQALLTALVGMAFGGGLIWAVRIVGTAALGREAMGFGDVLLMAMIGTLVGWQTTLIIFFVAPIAGLAVALVLWMLTGRDAICYGPFLCLATLLVIVFWSPIWEGWGRTAFSLGPGWLIPAMVAVCLILVGGMLRVWRMVKEALFVGSEE